MWNFLESLSLILLTQLISERLLAQHKIKVSMTILMESSICFEWNRNLESIDRYIDV
jgi:hypothetical protein